VATLGAGDYFGEIALLRHVPRTATVTAGTDLHLLALEREEFLAAVTGSTVASEAADREASRRLTEHPGTEPRDP
jgi:CRP-like cAMP-binding protein